MEGLEGLFRGPQRPPQPLIQLGPQGVSVHLLSFQLPDKFFSKLATSISGARCTCRQRVLSVPILFMNEADFKRDFLVKFLSSLGCSSCGRTSPEISYDGRKTVLKCTVCGHVTIK